MTVGGPLPSLVVRGPGGHGDVRAQFGEVYFPREDLGTVPDVRLDHALDPTGQQPGQDVVLVKVGIDARKRGRGVRLRCDVRRGGADEDGESLD